MAEHIDDLLVKLGLEEVPRELPVISASRAELQASFVALGGGDETLAWEVRPFNTAPFLRLARGDLLLLGVPWLLSWLGEGFHYRAMSHAQKLGSAELLCYTRFVGEIVERYALDLARAAIPAPATVLGEQAYGKGGGKRTSDVAIVWGKDDLVLFEIHARRVAATVAVTGTAAQATTEVSKLLVVKVNQVGQCIAALLDGTASLPDVDIEEIERIWPVVVSVGHVMQTRNLWSYMRESVDPAKTSSFERSRVQPLQLLDIADYEKLLGLAEAGEDIPEMLARKAAGPFRERDLAAWLHGDRAAPSDEPRPSLLESRWGEIGDRVAQMAKLAANATDQNPTGA